MVLRDYFIGFYWVTEEWFRLVYLRLNEGFPGLNSLLQFAAQFSVYFCEGLDVATH